MNDSSSMNDSSRNSSRNFVHPPKNIRILALGVPSQILSPLLQTIEAQGHTIAIEHRPTGNIEHIQATQPDLILINLRVTGTDGYLLCQTIRATPHIQDIPVIFLGDGVSKIQSVLALRSGANEYFSLPLQGEESTLRLTKHLDQSSLIRRLKADNIGLTHQLNERERILQVQESQQLSLSQQNQELKRLAFIDGLTQVANRRGFNQNLQELWSLLGRSQQPLAMILCDADHFKGYNDTYGHPAGDSCLQMIAEVITQATRRTSDFVARYGGEEFAILLPATHTDGAICVAKDIQTLIAQRQWPHKASPTHPFVTVSLGIASLVPRPFIAADRLTRLADKALYAAKQQGRNRLIASENSYLPEDQAVNDITSRSFVHSA